MAKTLEFEGDKLRKLALDLNRVAKKAVPHAIRNSLNTSAFVARFAWQGAIREKLITRNKFTVSRVLVNKARGTNVSTLESAVGHPEDYMLKQERGGIDRGAVPMPAASGEKSVPRRRLVRRPMKLRAITLGRRGRKGSKRQRNAASIRMALKTKGKFVFLDTGKTKGIYKLSGGKRKLKFRMIWNMKTKSRFIKPTKTLEPALNRIDGKLAGIHIRSLKEQLRRRRLMGF